MFIILVFLVVILGLLFVSIGRIVKQDYNLCNLIYLIGANMIFLLASCCFYFYFQEQLLTFISMVFLGIYAILLLKEIMVLSNKIDIFSIPYLSFVWFLLFVCVFQIV